MAKQKSSKSKEEMTKDNGATTSSIAQPETKEETIVLSDLLEKMKAEGKTYVRIQKLF